MVWTRKREREGERRGRGRGREGGREGGRENMHVEVSVRWVWCTIYLDVVRFSLSVRCLSRDPRGR